MLPPWAERIFSRLEELGRDKTQAGLARACGIDKVSVSNWKGKGTATKMISGDNLIAAAEYLETTAEWIMTGRRPSIMSQLSRFDMERLATAILAVEASQRPLTPETVAEAYGLSIADKAAVQLSPEKKGASGNDVVHRRDTGTVTHIGRKGGTRKK